MLIWTIAVLLLLAFGSRVLLLADQAVWWDEAWSVWTALQPFADVTEITARDVHPPLYQWLLFVWVRLAGISEFAIRLLSMYAGVISVALIYALARRIGGVRAGLLAALLASISTLHIAWSQEARMYALAATFTALAAYAYLRLDVCGSRWWVLLVIGGSGAALSQYLGGLALVILNLHWLLTLRQRPLAFHRRWLLAMMACVLLVGLWMLFAIGLIRTDGGPAVFDPLFVFHLVATLFAVGQSAFLNDYTVITLVVSAIFLVGLGLLLRADRRAGLLILLAALLPPLAVTLLSVPFNPFYAPAPEERYFVIFAPLVLAGFGLALDRLFLLSRLLGALAALTLLLIYSAALLDRLDARYYRDDYASLMATVSALARPEEPIFFTSGDRYPLVYYHLERAAGDIQVQNVQPISAAALESLDVPRFWLVRIEAHLDSASDGFVVWADANYTRALDIPVDYNGLTLYTRTDADVADLGADVWIMSPAHELRPGDEARMGIPGGSTVQLLHDDRVLAEDYADSWRLAAFPIYAAFPPGDYTLLTHAQRQTFRVTYSQPAPTNPPENVDTPLGPLRLLGYELDRARLRAGESLALTLYWRADERHYANYTVFAQLVGPFNPTTDSPVWAQHDGYPADTPTSVWWPGLTAADARQLTVPADAPSGDYTLIAGLYLLDTGERLLTPDGADHIVLGRVVVE
ncbi:MAG: glycosyltransferase family 39 protein [Phototrophicaceae bacterium]